MVSVAACGSARVAPADGLESDSETVSFPSYAASSVIGTETVFDVSPGAKLTVWLAFV